MKIYATTTSERATKGQGGNDYLDIEVKGENQEKLLELRITQNEDGEHYTVEGYAISYHAKNGDLRSESYVRYELKGKK